MKQKNLRRSSSSGVACSSWPRKRSATFSKTCQNLDGKGSWRLKLWLMSINIEEFDAKGRTSCRLLLFSRRTCGLPFRSLGEYHQYLIWSGSTWLASRFGSTSPPGRKGKALYSLARWVSCWSYSHDLQKSSSSRPRIPTNMLMVNPPTNIAFFSVGLSSSLHFHLCPWYL